MSSALVLLAAAALAPTAATWHMDGKPGEVTSVTGTVKTGGRIVADELVDDAGLKQDERGLLASPTFPAGTCAWASAARPFRRLRRFARDGRLLWEWHVDRVQQALRLHSGDGDCLSPDGGRLTIAVYRFSEDEPINELGRGVIAVDHRPRFVDAIGARTHLPFDSPRRSDLIGWQRGKPATLLFEVASETKFDKAGNPKIVSDSAVLSRAR